MLYRISSCLLDSIGHWVHHPLNVHKVGSPPFRTNAATAKVGGHCALAGGDGMHTRLCVAKAGKVRFWGWHGGLSLCTYDGSGRGGLSLCTYDNDDRRSGHDAAFWLNSHNKRFNKLKKALEPLLKEQRR